MSSFCQVNLFINLLFKLHSFTEADMHITLSPPCGSTGELHLSTTETSERVSVLLCIDHFGGHSRTLRTHTIKRDISSLQITTKIMRHTKIYKYMCVFLSTRFKHGRPLEWCSKRGGDDGGLQVRAGACVCVCACARVRASASPFRLTYQSLDVQPEVAALEVRVGAVPVQHDLGHALVHQLVVLGPGGDGRPQHEGP